MKANIIKFAAVILKEKKLLIVQPKKLVNEQLFISVGGKPENGESFTECLQREVREELQVGIVGIPKLYATSPIEPAAGKQNLTVQIFSYLVEISGNPKPSSEIAKMHWLTKTEFELKALKLGSVLEHQVIPMLIADNLLD